MSTLSQRSCTLVRALQRDVKKLLYYKIISRSDWNRIMTSRHSIILHGTACPLTSSQDLIRRFHLIFSLFCVSQRNQRATVQMTHVQQPRPGGTVCKKHDAVGVFDYSVLFYLFCFVLFCSVLFCSNFDLLRFWFVTVLIC